jgi:hypothetical protein
MDETMGKGESVTVGSDAMKSLLTAEPQLGEREE